MTNFKPNYRIALFVSVTVVRFGLSAFSTKNFFLTAKPRPTLKLTKIIKQYHKRATVICKIAYIRVCVANLR